MVAIFNFFQWSLYVNLLHWIPLTIFNYLLTEDQAVSMEEGANLDDTDNSTIACTPAAPAAVPRPIRNIPFNPPPAGEQYGTLLSHWLILANSLSPPLEVTLTWWRGLSVPMKKGAISGSGAVPHSTGATILKRSFPRFQTKNFHTDWPDIKTLYIPGLFFLNIGYDMSTLESNWLEKPSGRNSHTSTRGKRRTVVRSTKAGGYIFSKTPPPSLIPPGAECSAPYLPCLVAVDGGGVDGWEGF